MIRPTRNVDICPKSRYRYLTCTLEKCIPDPLAKSAGQTPDHLQNTRVVSAWPDSGPANIAGACSPPVEATLRGLDSNTPRPPIFVLLVSPPHQYRSQSRRNRSPRTPHSNHRSPLTCFDASASISSPQTPSPSSHPNHNPSSFRICSR